MDQNKILKDLIDNMDESVLLNDALKGYRLPSDYTEEERMQIKNMLYYGRLLPYKREKLEQLCREWKREEKEQSKKIEKREQIKRKLHFKKIVVRAGLIALLTTVPAVSLKVYRDYKQNIEVKGRYDLSSKTITIKSGDTIISIAKKIHADLPEDLQEVETVHEVISTICRMNPKIENIDKIQNGWEIDIPVYTPKMEETKTKN